MSGGGCDRRERGQRGAARDGSTLQAGRVGMSGSGFRRWRIDPGGGRFCRRYRRLVDEALRVVAERLIERELASGVDGIGLTVVHLVRSHQTDAAMVVILVVPIEEAAAEASGVLDAAEALGELRLVLECLEVALRERVVVGHVRAIVRAGDAKIGEQQSGGLGLHWPAAIGMQSELARRHVML